MMAAMRRVATFREPRSLSGSSLQLFNPEGERRAARRQPRPWREPKAVDALDPRTCPRYGLIGNHWAGWPAFVAALRDELAKHEELRRRDKTGRFKAT